MPLLPLLLPVLHQQRPPHELQPPMLLDLFSAAAAAAAAAALDMNVSDAHETKYDVLTIAVS